MLAGAVGALSRDRGRAFLAGIGTHLVTDLLPHRDFSVPLEMLLMAAALATVGGIAGFDSPAFAGAVGGVAPDAENGLVAARLIKRPCFPTHQEVHGRRTKEAVSQMALSCAAFGLALWYAGRNQRSQRNRRPR